MSDAPSESPAVVIFDGVCNFCDRSVRFVMNRDRQKRFVFAANSSEAGTRLLREHGIDPADVSSVYLVKGGRIWDRSSAALEVVRELPLPWKLLYGFVIVPRPIRDWAYRLIARNRYRLFGKAAACRLPSEAERARFLA